jgi:hypothetical protein
MPTIASTVSGAEPDSGGVGSLRGAISASEKTAQSAISAMRATRKSWRLRVTTSAGAALSAASAAATSSPTGVARTKPPLGASRRTFGVASAWSPRKPAAARKPSDTRNSRPSPRRAATSPVA